MLKVAITIIVCVFVWLAFQSLMSDVVAGSASSSLIESVMATLTSAYDSMDFLFPFIVGGLLLVSTIFAYKTGSNVLLAIISFILWIISVILSVLFVNVYLAVSGEFPTIYAAFPVMDIIMSNLHFFTLGWLAIITLVMFRKNNKEDTSNMDQRFYGA
ncbi:MAG: hypothetical protein PHS54_01215 [Clostridia bacterium]|nr:hypothetical protein [Clostridia bacterium]